MRKIWQALGLVAVLGATGCNAGSSTVVGNAGGYPGAVYAQTNAAGGNAVVHYGRSADGILHYIDQASTGGNGTGLVNLASNANAVDPLFSANSVVLSADHSRVFAVNAASNSITSFAVTGSGSLQMVGTYPTGGLAPTSIAVSGATLYVSCEKANAAGKQLFGFHLNGDGSLTALSNAQYAPSATTIVDDIRFSPNGQLLAMTELMTNIIDMYPVNSDGTLGTPVRNPSAATGPFSTLFLDNSHVFVSEVHPNVQNVGSVSSYLVNAGGTMSVVSGNVSNGQNATCWLRATPNGQYLFASNTTSGNVSVYAIGSGGSLTLAHANEAYLAPQGTTDFLGNPSSGPVDAVVSADGQYLYQEYSGLGVIAAYQIQSDGSLLAVTAANGLNLPPTGNEGQDGY